ncbi:MAG: acyltransferase [Thermodesulfobacteriota bacterium]
MPDQAMPRKQLYYLDNLKVLLIMLVVMHHSAEAYTAGQSWGIVSPERTALLQPLMGINSSFFMGLFFLISGYFVPKSYASYGTGLFLWKKIQRLLIPALFVVAVVLPLSFWLCAPGAGFWRFYLQDWWSGKYFNFGHMWFVLDLFFYCLVYGLLMAVRRRPATALRPPGHAAILLFAVLLGIATTAVNAIWPINTWLCFHLIEPYHAPQYIFLFAVGIAAGKHQWFQAMPSRLGYIWFGAAVFFMALFVAYFAVTAAMHEPFFHPVPFIWWGSFFCTAMCTGLVVVFREQLNKTNALLAVLSGNSYGVYLFHIFFVFLADRMLLNWKAPVVVKFLCTFLFVAVISNILVWLLRMVRPVRKFI